MFALSFWTLLAFAPPAEAGPAGEPLAATEPPIARRFGGFVGAEWRVMGIGGHLSHGPGFSVGAIFFDHLALGLSGFARSGPINPQTFTYALPEGQTYKGQTSLKLRSDGSVIGLLIAPFHDFRRVPLNLELPIMVGYGGFGFYLHGEDRKVPDDRRVSEWENDLLDGRDSDPVNLALELGLRLAWTPRSAAQVRPYLGVHYLWVPGFDTAVLTNYNGISGVIGVKFGKFPGARPRPR